METAEFEESLLLEAMLRAEAVSTLGSDLIALAADTVAAAPEGRIQAGGIHVLETAEAEESALGFGPLQLLGSSVPHTEGVMTSAALCSSGTGVEPRYIPFRRISPSQPAVAPPAEPHARAFCPAATCISSPGHSTACAALPWQVTARAHRTEDSCTAAASDPADRRTAPLPPPPPQQQQPGEDAPAPRSDDTAALRDSGAAGGSLAPPAAVRSGAVAALLGDLEDLQPASPGDASGLWTGVWQGRRVAVRLRALPPPAPCANEDETETLLSGSGPSPEDSLCGAERHLRCSLALLGAPDLDSWHSAGGELWRGLSSSLSSRNSIRNSSGSGFAQGYQHSPGLMPLLDVRVAALDADSWAELFPAPTWGPAWGPRRNSCGRVRPFGGRLQRFLETSGMGETTPSHRDLAVCTGELGPSPAQPQTPALQALRSVCGLAPGGRVMVALMEHCSLGHLGTTALSRPSPFLASPCRPLHEAQRSLLRTAREVASGLAALHEAGMAHGALRPSNVLLAPAPAPSWDHRRFAARLTDVGSASLETAAACPLGPRLPADCLLAVAPEALASAGAMHTPAADVYAYGMLLYVMAAGRAPFEGQNTVSVLMAVATEGLVPEWPAGQHDHLAPLFARCVAAHPAERPSAAEVLEEICALERALKERRKRHSGVVAYC
ncbi:hypothetical protein HYH03_012988 [Edaphochlamys debaryana]|uniref:Protein kinase domain-containing protein n=1 Tax=Edaphochlamys debaryana TaxID=47281 RepID=A0A836BV01_9CHLO|nr:hypothetical protein HYH03_012988 [Edaphochlamys debaryana]|eukprot:KAG2488484.1 hypothetical protein HYH03_012988 [Edaphochlamys debaryana]